MATSQPFQDLADRKLFLRVVAPVEAHYPELQRVAPIAEDSEWLDALARGDEAALGRLYREHHMAVRGLVRRLLSSSTEIEDVVHDVFVAAPSAFLRYRGEGTVRAFVFSIAVHQVQHHLRGATRRRTWLDRFRLAPVHPPPPPTPEAETERRKLALRLRVALESLSLDHRMAVVLCEVEEMTSGEAATVLGIPEATVRTRLHHAKKKLRALFEEEGSL